MQSRLHVKGKLQKCSLRGFNSTAFKVSRGVGQSSVSCQTNCRPSNMMVDGVEDGARPAPWATSSNSFRSLLMSLLITCYLLPQWSMLQGASTRSTIADNLILDMKERFLNNKHSSCVYSLRLRNVSDGLSCAHCTAGNYISRFRVATYSEYRVKSTATAIEIELHP